MVAWSPDNHGQEKLSSSITNDDGCTVITYLEAKTTLASKVTKVDTFDTQLEACTVEWAMQCLVHHEFELGQRCWRDPGENPLNAMLPGTTREQVVIYPTAGLVHSVGITFYPDLYARIRTGQMTVTG